MPLIEFQLTDLRSVGAWGWWAGHRRLAQWLSFHRMATTNYFNTFIEVADDCPVAAAEAPPEREPRTVAAIEFRMVTDHPYSFTSDDVLFAVHAHRHQVPEARLVEERERFFAKGQACFRSSPLPKRYGWGVHSNAEGKIAIYPLGSATYHELATRPDIVHLKAMRSRRA